MTFYGMTADYKCEKPRDVRRILMAFLFGIYCILFIIYLLTYLDAPTH